MRDFSDLCAALGIRIEASAALVDGRPARPMDPAHWTENWRAEQAIFLLSRPGRSDQPVAPAQAPSDDLFAR